MKGLAISEGIGLGTARWVKAPTAERPLRSETGEAAIAVLRAALAEVEEELSALAKSGLKPEIREVLEAHRLMLNDPMFAAGIEEKIDQGIAIEQAVRETESELVQLFAQLDDPYLRERASDIRDLSKRILMKLVGNSGQEGSGDQSGYIIISQELTPSDILGLDAPGIRGILTARGGPTSHVAIIARSLGIPALSGLPAEDLNSIQEGDLIVVDGIQGQALVNPAPELVASYRSKIKLEEARRIELERYRGQKGATKDGRSIEIALNIGDEKEAEALTELGADGIGLFRTELFYANREEWPTEEEQFLVYRQVLEKAGSRPVIVRTLDIGGDKALAYSGLKKEDNPFLGLRAIRLCLKEPDIFRTQLRALLRASVFGNLKIMLPMISGVHELAEAKAILSSVRAELESEGFAVAEHIPVGIMVEIPSAAVMADILVQEADFFSIGTNDLVQYTLAVDRLNDQVGYLYDHFHPAVLRLIRTVIEAGKRAGKWVGMCGEMAGDPLAIPLLVGLGIDELSMNKNRILAAKKIVAASSSLEDWSEVFNVATAAQVREILQRKQPV